MSHLVGSRRPDRIRLKGGIAPRRGESSMFKGSGELFKTDYMGASVAPPRPPWPTLKKFEIRLDFVRGGGRLDFHVVFMRHETEVR